MAGIAGSPCFESYLYCQTLPFLNSSFHQDSFIMQSWDSMLAEMRYHLFRIYHKLQAFNISGEWKVADHRFNRCTKTAIQIVSFWALLMEIGSYTLFQYTVLWRPKHRSYSKGSSVSIESVVNSSLLQEVSYTGEQELPVICRVAEQKLSFEAHSLKRQLNYGARTTGAILRSWKYIGPNILLS